ncbi:MAG TPA: glycosyltransferase family 2 protein [Thermoleophilaceae bacterium]
MSSAPSVHRPAFPDDLVLTPVSRRPTRLEEATLRTILDRPVPAFPAASAGPAETSVIVVTRDNLPFLRLCLESALEATGAPFELIVVDNGSSDGTAEYLARLAELNPAVRLIANASNRGFAAANNQAAALASADVLVLLNDDTAVTHGWLERLTAQLEGPRVGMVGPTTNRIGNEAQIEAHYRTWGELVDFAAERAARHAGEAFEIPMLTMFCVAMRRSLYEAIGPLDERFEIGLLEDDDYSRRVREAGYRLLCADDAFVHHFGETSFGKLAASGEYSRVLEANRARFEEKWGAPWQPYNRRQSPSYLELIENVRQAVAAVVPAGAKVLIVSRGDEELLHVEGRRTGHFPCADNGAYAGHHPADGREAIGLVAAEREAGADYLVFPATAMWWLDHYEDLRLHLNSRYARVVSDPQSCVIFDLAGARR